MIALPEAETTYHLPPKKFWPWPEIWPALLAWRSVCRADERGSKPRQVAIWV